MGLAIGNSCLVSMELRWARRRTSKSDNAASYRSIPIHISTSKKDINLDELRHLYSLCNHSCNRLSVLGGDDSIVDVKKLRKAISHSDVVVSVFCSSHHADLDAVLRSEEEEGSLYPSSKEDDSSLGDMFQDALLHLSPSNGKLVGFGRAYSDHGLTASIHDLMVLPSLRRMGIGKLIVNRVVRLLTSRDIYDIAALCFEDERPFFKACGFGDDRMGSTTMMFTKSLDEAVGSSETTGQSKFI